MDELNNNQVQMLLNLEGATEDKPFNLSKVYNLNEPRNLEDYSNLDKGGYLKGFINGECLTRQGPQGSRSTRIVLRRKTKSQAQILNGNNKDLGSTFNLDIRG